MAEVTVDATWRMSRVEFNTPYEPAGTVVGFGEVLLQDPTTPITGLRRRRAGSTASVYTAMPGGTVTRIIDEVKDDVIDVDGVEITFTQAMSAMERFLQKWMIEDESQPEPGAVPPQDAVSSVPVLGEHPPMGDELPKPLDPFAPLGPEPVPLPEPIPHGEER